ncbi:unnamed protein product [Blepharisma stoltei]|uniref:Protein kinase domain-containing protein n=1 Tax=Blepharisma stoltei TaxID=1481888 RepID=A0AAU9KC40_9CILI|nr:unnamed protein product [Blepharisma stoltei]
MVNKGEITLPQREANFPTPANSSEDTIIEEQHKIYAQSWSSSSSSNKERIENIPLEILSDESTPPSPNSISESKSSSNIETSTTAPTNTDIWKYIVLLLEGNEINRKDIVNNKLTYQFIDFQDIFKARWKDHSQNLQEKKSQKLNSSESCEQKSKYNFFSLLQPYYSTFESEEEFKKVNDSSTNPKIEEYEAISKRISDKNTDKFKIFLKIYKIYSQVEVEDDEHFDLSRARDVLDLLDDRFFIQKHSPKYETYSLIDKFKINIANQLNKSTSKDEITGWIFIAHEISIKWKNIEMTDAIILTCNRFMNLFKEEKVQNDKLLVILNKFIGPKEENGCKLGSEALEWLKANYRKEGLNSRMKAMISAIKKNRFKLEICQKDFLENLQNKLQHWTFSAYRKINSLKRRSKNLMINGIARNLKIINKGEIENIRKFCHAYGGNASLYECIYKNENALIKKYKYTKSSKDEIKKIVNEIANAIYLSKINETNIYTKVFGLFLEEIGETKEKEKIYCINLLMEKCSGTLEEYIDNFNCDDNAFSDFADSLLNGILLLHQHGLSINNITPSKIL